jgi:gas vesicle structural protein
MAAIFFSVEEQLVRELSPNMSSPRNNILIADTSGDETSLLDILDHVLNAGVIIRGNLVISLAGVDLVYVGLDVILTSVETALRHLQSESPPAKTKPHP